MARHLHLDLVGGISGDMFIGAVLDAFPDYAEGLSDVVAKAGFPELVQLECHPHSDGTLTGTRFNVSPLAQAGHHHRHYSDIKQILSQAALPQQTVGWAQDIFRRIAEAEASIHGKAVADIAFHEVGAWDSIADIVLAAHLIASLDASWSCSSVPGGSGLVDTQHGKLPVPAPATSLLLEGFSVYDDGVPGERVTPTGAAILAALAPSFKRPEGIQGKLGYGFGAKVFPGFSNILRLTVYDTQAEEALWQTDQVARLSFEVDDLTPENLALALDRLRATEGVIDVTQAAYFGKKLRQGNSISLLVQLEAQARALAQIFTETSSLGVRREVIGRAVLPRRDYQVAIDGHQYSAKVAKRPGGLTAKAELDELAATGLDLAGREALRARIEAAALTLAQEDFAQEGFAE